MIKSNLNFPGQLPRRPRILPSSCLPQTSAQLLSGTGSYSLVSLDWSTSTWRSSSPVFFPFPLIWWIPVPSTLTESTSMPSPALISSSTWSTSPG